MNDNVVLNEILKSLSTPQVLIMILFQIAIPVTTYRWSRYLYEFLDSRGIKISEKEKKSWKKLLSSTLWTFFIILMFFHYYSKIYPHIQSTRIAPLGR